MRTARALLPPCCRYETPRVVQPVNAEMIGGVPLVSVIGTPRVMGEHLGSRMKPRLQVLSQYLLEQLGSLARSGGVTLTGDRLSAHLREAVLPAAKLEPGLWMEIESMARAADLPAEELLLIHGSDDLLSFYRCQVPPTRSTAILLPGARCLGGRPLLALAWHLDPALLPYVTLLRRMPAHGPASLALTLAGLHAVAGLSEAGIAAASSDLRVTDGQTGHFTSHLLTATLSAPALDDCRERLSSVPRHGGRAVLLLADDGRRLGVELSGGETAWLGDPQPSCPRLHTNHALAPAVRAVASTAADPSARERLTRLAALAIEAEETTPEELASWFGLGPDLPGSEARRTQAREIGAMPDTTVLLIADPMARTVFLRRGGAANLESIGL